MHHPNLLIHHFNFNFTSILPAVIPDNTWGNYTLQVINYECVSIIASLPVTYKGSKDGLDSLYTYKDLV